MRTTFHMIAAADWQETGDAIRPDSLTREGFIHCTDDRRRLTEVANRHYRDDPRAYLILTVDLDATGSPWQFDDPDHWYPHVYGPIARAAVLDSAPFPRDADGTFLDDGVMA